MDLDAMLVLKDFLVSIDSKAALSIKHVCSFDFRSDYLFNMSLENLNNVDLCLIIGSNSRGRHQIPSCSGQRFTAASLPA